MLVVLTSKVIPFSDCQRGRASSTEESLRAHLCGGRRPQTYLRPEIRRDYPLNLSISISGGKETNKDSPSNGE